MNMFQKQLVIDGKNGAELLETFVWYDGRIRLTSMPPAPRRISIADFESDMRTVAQQGREGGAG